MLVEDSPTDVMMIEDIMTQATVRSILHVVQDGSQAMKFLRRENGYTSVPRPDLILLDLQLPRKTGQEVLAEIKGDERLKTIPVIVLTSSQAEQDVQGAYRHYANCYIAKPVDYARFAEVVRAIERFWFEVVTTPEQ